MEGGGQGKRREVVWCVGGGGGGGGGGEMGGEGEGSRRGRGGGGGGERKRRGRGEGRREGREEGGWCSVVLNIPAETSVGTLRVRSVGRRWSMRLDYLEARRQQRHTRSNKSK